MSERLPFELEPATVGDLIELRDVLYQLMDKPNYYQQVVVNDVGHPNFHVVFRGDKETGHFEFQEFTSENLESEVKTMFKERVEALPSGLGFRTKLKN